MAFHWASNLVFKWHLPGKSNSLQPCTSGSGVNDYNISQKDHIRKQVDQTKVPSPEKSLITSCSAGGAGVHFLGIRLEKQIFSAILSQMCYYRSDYESFIYYKSKCGT